MNKKIMYVGVDVDDKAFHIGFLALDTGEFNASSCRPSLGLLIEKLKVYSAQGYTLKICYEACHIGFTLQRDLSEKGFECVVISSSDIPRTSGPQVKTDRIDAQKLAQYYASGLLNPIFVPSAEQESERDLVRSRGFLKGQASNVKRFILSTCRKANLDYRKAEGQSDKSVYWTMNHRLWLTTNINKLKEPAWRFNLTSLLASLKQIEEQIAFYDEEIQTLSGTSRYEKAVHALTCFRGFENLSAMTVLTEMVTAKRFKHPKQLTSFMGMDITEYSSGGKERKGGITKMGNTHLRRTLIESCQYASCRVQISTRLKARRNKAPSQKCLEIADRCMRRLHKRSHHLHSTGKHNNKIKVACAREMMGFVWETLNVVGF